MGEIGAGTTGTALLVSTDLHPRMRPGRSTALVLPGPDRHGGHPSDGATPDLRPAALLPAELLPAELLPAELLPAELLPAALLRAGDPWPLAATSRPLLPPPAFAAPTASVVAAAPEQPSDPELVRALAARAERAGVGAVWTADYSGTVELRRMAGPHDREIGATHWRWGEPPHAGPWRLANTAVKATIYRVILATGTQFEIYRWVNLIDLARLWPELDLPDGVRGEWGTALRAAGLASRQV